ncbi:MAG: hypothetical protein IKY91_05580 [Akkermansia sp.]|nr:hypothetical protein [Akkermansia sp.]
MAKNEAKVKFTAETREFNASIKKANDEMSKLRAELKLNETQMKGNGASVESLESKHELLASQLQANQSKIEALTNKLETARRMFGDNSDEVSRLERQLLAAKTAEENINQAIKKVNAELDDQRAAENRVETATEKLTNTINRQESELKQLKGEYVEAVLKFGDASDEAKQLEGRIEQLSRELGDNRDKMDAAANAADRLGREVDDAGDAARNSGDGFTVAKGAISDLISEAVQFGIEKISEFIGYLKELPEATREIRQDMATLDTSFQEMGFSTEQATNTWKEMYTIFGEDDRAVEASNLVAKMCDNQKELNDWVTITTGIWGTYQDSLPVEGLAEAAMETAKTGTVTGNFADALNWSSEAAEMFSKYMSEDVVTAEDAFNEALKECSNEEERQALITETLTSLYGDAAAKYEEASGSQLAAKEAAAELALAEQNLANQIEPVTTAWDGLKTQLITAVTPAISTVCGWLTQAANYLKEHPTLCNALAAAFAVLGAGITAVAIGWGIYTVAQMAANAAMLPVIGIALAVVAAIAAVVAIGVALYQNWDTIKAKAKEAWDSIKNAVSNATTAAKDAVTKGWNAVKSTTSSVWNGIKSTLSSIWNGIKSAVTSASNAVKSTVTSAWNAVKSTTSSAFNAVKSTATSAWNAIKSAVSSAVNSVKSTVTSAFNSIKSTATSVWNGIKSAISNAINGAKSAVSSAVSGIKSIMNFSWSLPKLKLPRISVSGKFSLNPPSAPKFSISWYRKAMNHAMILNGATIFGAMGGKLLGGGEAGREVVSGADTLMGMIQTAVDRASGAMDIQALADAIEDLATRPAQFYIGDRQVALATASAADNVNGLRSTLKSRGLALD